jgi:hypothetical protein
VVPEATIMVERGGKVTYMLFGSTLAAGLLNPAFDWQEDTMPLGVEVR